jgi:hypothetical protein
MAKNTKYWATKPTTSAAVLNKNPTIEPIIPGKAAADFFTISILPIS